MTTFDFLRREIHRQFSSCPRISGWMNFNSPAEGHYWMAASKNVIKLLVHHITNDNFDALRNLLLWYYFQHI